jgi:hypothetical protein
MCLVAWCKHHVILSTAPQLSISQKSPGTLPEDGNVMSKHVVDTILQEVVDPRISIHSSHMTVAKFLALRTGLLYPWHISLVSISVRANSTLGP